MTLGGHLEAFGARCFFYQPVLSKSDSTCAVDSGTENLNNEVASLMQVGLIERVIAQTEIDFSNSMIERFFRTIKHKWLYLVSLPTFDAAHSAIGRYMTDYNHLIPLHVLGGGTPFEMWSDKRSEAAKAELAPPQMNARDNRKTYNKTVSCGLCPV